MDRTEKFTRQQDKVTLMFSGMGVYFVQHLFVCLFIIFLCMYMCQSVYGEGRKQLFGVGFLFLLCGA